MTAIDVGGKLACVLIKLHPREWRQTERQRGGAEGVMLSLLTLFNLNGHAQRSTLFGQNKLPDRLRSLGSQSGGSHENLHFSTSFLF